MTKRLVILDFSLEGRAGHAAEYDGNVLRAFRDQGWDCAVYGNRKCTLDSLNGVPVTPWFTFSPTDTVVPPRLLRPFAKIVVHGIRTAAEIRRAMEKEGGTDTVFFVQYAEPYEVFALSRAMGMVAERDKGRLALLLRTPCLRMTASGPAPTFRSRLFALALGRLARLGNRAVLMTDSAALKTEYGGLTDRDIHVVPIPNPPPAAAGHARRIPDTPLHIVQAGRMAVEKGIAMVPAIMAALRRRSVPARFTIQTFLHPTEDPSPYGKILQALEGGKRSEDRLVAEPVSIEDYYAQLRAADVALLLYEPERYRAATSNIMIDALAAGCFPIVSEGSWMADIVYEIGFGAVIAPQPMEMAAEAVADVLAAGIPDKTPESVARIVAYHTRDSFCRHFTEALAAER